MGVLRRRILLVAVLVVATIGAALAQGEKVYVTKTGEKYHRGSCKSLSKSKIEMPLAKAAARYGACKICKPPVPAVTPANAMPSNASVVAATPRAAVATSGQCQATTKKGPQCSRKAQVGRSYCWQH